MDSSNEYDELDRLIRTADHAGSVREYGYDSRGNRVLETLVDDQSDPVQQTRYVYDGLNRLVQTIRDLDGDGANVGDPDDIIVTQTWDDSSRLIAQTDDNGNATRYAYDASNRKIATRMADGTLHQVGSGLESEDWPEGSLVPDLTDFVSGYDAHDNQVTTTDANDTVVVNVYDLLNRLTDRTITPGSGVSTDTTFETYEYDGLSRIVRAEDDDSVVIREYDSLGNIIAETLFVGEPVCGNGVVEPGEQCDPPDGVSCDAECQTIGHSCCETGGPGCNDPDIEDCVCNIWGAPSCCTTAWGRDVCLHCRGVLRRLRSGGSRFQHYER